MNPLAMADLRQRIVSGLGWSGASQLVNQGIRFVIAVILARLLTPEEFGLLGMVYIFTGFAAIFGDMGLGSALIQRRSLGDEHLNAVFWVNVLAGVALTLLFIAGAPLVAQFYREPSLTAITRVVAFQFFLSSLNTVQTAQLRRGMDFRRLALIETGAAAVAGGIGIGMALGGLGVWSLVGQSLAHAAVGVALMWRLSPWRPHLSFSWTKLKDLLGFGSNLLGFNAFNYWVRSVDDLLIGRIVGPAALGVYTRAYALMLLPLTQISEVLGRVMFPALSSIQADTDRVRSIYLRAIRSIALFTFPMMVGLLVVADEFVLALLGPRWADVIPILRLFSLVGLVQSIGTTVGWIYQSQGRTDLMFRWGVASGGVLLVSFGIGIQWGMIGVAVAYTIVSGVIVPYPLFAIPGRLINLSFREIVRTLKPVAACALGMGVVVFLADVLMPTAWPDWVALLSQVGIGVLVYTGLVRGIPIEGYTDLRAILRERRLEQADLASAEVLSGQSGGVGLGTASPSSP